MNAQSIFLISLSFAVVTFVAAIGKARWNWRKDIAPFGISSKTYDILLHPERYAEAQVIPIIRTLAAIGLFFLIASVSVLVYQLFMEIK